MYPSHFICSIPSHERKYKRHLLPPERASFCESGLATSGLAENGRAASADDNGLSMREDSCDCEAAGALDVHEERTRSWYKSLVRRLRLAFCYGFNCVGGEIVGLIVSPAILFNIIPLACACEPQPEALG